ncbi:MAG TPA: 5'/3'-nucleotidase SurE [Bacteroidota bacterium]|nr:5'/3'-nucleotidase SurE [Bacteroidota bacterium]
MHILVSNDDGIDAQGIYALTQELRHIGRVTVVAPDRQQSAVGHAITMQYPLRAMPFHKNGELFGYAVKGTPADAVKLAVRCLLKEPVDLLISGINHGSNTAINILYSGTVSAATEGTILGIPSIAVSLTTYEEADFGPAAKFACSLAELVLQHGLPQGTLLNVNVPAVSEASIRGVKITKQGRSSWDDTFDVRRDPSNREYYWLTGKMNITDTDPETDQVAIRENFISVTPIHYDLTDASMFEELKRWGLQNGSAH